MIANHININTQGRGVNLVANETYDLTYRTDRTGNMVKGKRGEYVCNLAQLLFNMVPGTDEYEPDKGLDIARKRNRTYTKETRDTDYENQIVTQFTKYTDLIPVNVIAMYMNNSLHIYMSIRFEGAIYEMDLIDSNDSLTAMLRNN